MQNTVYLALGSNLGNREKYIQRAIVKIKALIGIIENQAPIYESEPWGFDNNNWFLNTVIKVKTKLSASDVLSKCKKIESELGRTGNNKKPGYSSRTIDIDILFFNKEIINTADLVIPHPYIQSRNFVLFPLNDLAANFFHPVLKKTIQELKKNCPDNGFIKILSP